MGLVEYSDSESDGEGAPSQPTPAAAPKKAFHKLLDRSSGSGKIVVSLPAASNDAPDADATDEQPPAKRTKTLGGSRFSGLGSFLPPPKRARPPENKPGETSDAGLRLKTGAEPAFERTSGVSAAGDSAEPPLNSHGRAGPTIPEGQKPEEEVALVGKPLLFKPLSVARKKKPPTKDKKKDAGASAARGAPRTAEGQPPAAAAAPEPAKEEENKKRKKVSLFSMGEDEPPSKTATINGPSSTYEPVFTSTPGLSVADGDYDGDESAVTSAYPSTTAPVEAAAAYQYAQQQQPPPTQTQQQPHDFASLAATLTPAERRELFGRNPQNTTSSTTSSLLPASSKVITFDMEREYAHNEALRSAAATGGEGSVGPQHNPVRAIAPGKHSLRQVVNMAQSNQGALEESFARAKSSQRDAAGRYGWK